MLNLSVEIDQKQLADVQERLAYLKNGANRAISRALNKTANKAKTLAIKAICAEANLTKEYVRGKLDSPSTRFACRATVNKLEARLSAPKRGIRLEHFLVSPMPAHAGKPVMGEEPRVKIKPAGVEETIHSGFWVNAKNSGGLLIAVRNDILRKLNMKDKISGRLPYSVLYGPSVSQLFTDIKDRMNGPLTETLAKNLNHEMEWLIVKNPPPPGDGSTEE